MSFPPPRDHDLDVPDAMHSGGRLGIYVTVLALWWRLQPVLSLIPVASGRGPSTVQSMTSAPYDTPQCVYADRQCIQRNL